MSQSLEVLIYEILQYASQCMESDVEPSIDEMRKLANGNKAMFTAAMEACCNRRLLSGLYIPDYVSIEQSRVYGSRILITADGREFLEENRDCKEVN